MKNIPFLIFSPTLDLAQPSSPFPFLAWPAAWRPSRSPYLFPVYSASASSPLAHSRAPSSFQRASLLPHRPATRRFSFVHLLLRSGRSARPAPRVARTRKRPARSVRRRTPPLPPSLHSWPHPSATTVPFLFFPGALLPFPFFAHRWRVRERQAAAPVWQAANQPRSPSSYAAAAHL